ncbi:hypothetical protein SAMN06295912_12834 [Sphingomonas laterariae]|uniref:DUF2059 domain-containing protein n=1 Tax=Edaphosphingomonas laterariae TaxID=861865 RepID=A0A239IY82_9SPHN|nr:DUF2059 domain-containing protein [Sphingomonas laterariae]SNS98736.1 hypothetical protein SAMN06295912_12834 [Sphingomonas laterariae]
MMRSLALALAIVSLPVPALAQNAVAETRKDSAAGKVAKDKPDPARMAAARPVISKLWPLGTYKKMMDRTLDTMLDGIVAGMFSAKASDMAEAGGVAPGEAGKLGDASLQDVARAKDPHFDERMSITMKVMMGEMTDMMTRLEPQIQDAMAAAYARRFTLDQLADIQRFFATPTGSLYASESMLLMSDPEMMEAMQGFMPELTRALPAIVKKAHAATAHLPPPPMPNRADTAAEDTPEGT